jgi:hypothetical protein
MVVTPAGMAKDVRDEQPQNALPPMVVTPAGMAKGVRDE